MAPFDDAVADAGTAADALRGLAHASRHLPRPRDSYPVLGELLAGAGSLEQVVRQLADLHTQHADRVRTDDGDTAAGAAAATAAAAALRHTAALLRLVQQHLDAASAASGRIVWPHTPSPGITGPAAPPVRQATVRDVPQRPTAGPVGRSM